MHFVSTRDLGYQETRFGPFRTSVVLPRVYGSYAVRLRWNNPGTICLQRLNVVAVVMEVLLQYSKI